MIECSKELIIENIEATINKIEKIMLVEHVTFFSVINPYYIVKLLIKGADLNVYGGLDSGFKKMDLLNYLSSLKDDLIQGFDSNISLDEYLDHHLDDKLKEVEYYK